MRQKERGIKFWGRVLDKKSRIGKAQRPECDSLKEGKVEQDGPYFFRKTVSPL